MHFLKFFECSKQAAVLRRERERWDARVAALVTLLITRDTLKGEEAAYCALLCCCCCLYTNRKFVATLCACAACARGMLRHLHALSHSLSLCGTLSPFSLILILSLSLHRLRLVRVTLLAALFACSPKMRVPVIMCALALASCVCRERECAMCVCVCCY